MVAVGPARCAILTRDFAAGDFSDTWFFLYLLRRACAVREKTTRPTAWCMIPKCMPLGFDPTGENRFSERSCANAKSFFTPANLPASLHQKIAHSAASQRLTDRKSLIHHSGTASGPGRKRPARRQARRLSEIHNHGRSNVCSGRGYGRRARALVAPRNGRPGRSRSDLTGAADILSRETTPMPQS
jgi:hypothetical protein